MAELEPGAIGYLVVMLGIIAVLSAIFLPSLLWKRCGACRARNPLDAQECHTCHQPFPVE